jgi:hypothetical protein
MSLVISRRMRLGESWASSSGRELLAMASRVYA